MPHLDEIRRAVSRHEPDLTPFQPERRRAAVALVLAGPPAGLSLCFIRRAEREGDPWSGHMAFPGGRAHPEDPTPRAVAERETEEEVGLQLAPEHFLGALSELPVRIGGQETGIRLSPFVYYLGTEAPSLHLNYEVAAAYWVPLAHLWEPAHGTHLDVERHGRQMVYPAVCYADTVIWGLTLRVLTLFSDVLDHPLPHLEEIPGLGR